MVAIVAELTLSLTLLLACAWSLLAWALHAYGRRRIPSGSFDSIVVAGCRVDPTGEPSRALVLRTERAVALWQDKRAPILVFTGGVGRYPPAEGAVAAAHARSLGVPESAIVVEARSTTTEDNARLASELLGRGRILVVTHAYHVFRAERVFARHFDEARGVGVPGLGWPRVRAALREVAAVGWYFVRGRLRNPSPPRSERR